MPLQIPSKEIQWEARKFPLTVVADNIHSPSNVGLIIRSCECFGVERLYFVGNHSMLDSHKFKKAARSADKYLDIKKHEDNLSIIQNLKSEGYTVVALEIVEGGIPLNDFRCDPLSKYAIVIGSERYGISPHVLENVEGAVFIQQYGKTGSLNVAMALNIALYHLSNQLL